MKPSILKIIIVSIATLIISTYANISHSNTILSNNEREYLRLKKEIYFVSQNNYPPFEFINKENGNDGMCIELVRWIATEFSFQPRFINTSFSEAQQMIQDGKADVLTSFFYSKKRDETFNFSKAMFKIPSSLFVKNNRPDINSLNSLNGKVIAIQKGDYAEDFLKQKKIDFKVIHTKNFAEAIKLVISGKADTVIGDEQIVLYYLYSNNLEDKIKKVGKPLYIGENSMAVKEGQNILNSIINKGVELAYSRGVIQQINNKWLGETLPQSSLFYKYRYYIYSSILLAFSSVFIVWILNLNLRKMVNIRTKELMQYQNDLEDKIKYRTKDLEESRENAVIMLKDVSTQKQIVEDKNRELNTLYEQLNEEIKQKEMYEKTLFVQKKFIDMGQMINAISHQWRQPLNNIELTSQMMKEIYHGVDYNIEYDLLASQHTDLVQHMSATIDDFRNFFSPNKQKVWYSVVKEILKTIDLVKPQINNHGIDIVFKCQCSKHSIECNDDYMAHYCNEGRDNLLGYPTELRQVLLNLLSNAKDAILSLSSKEENTTKKIILNVTIHMNEYKITVFNYGKQIPDDVIPNIFDPYFTTKDEGKGTGIGLYMSKMIIENNMNGKLTCNNEEDGVIFTIVFNF